MYKGDRSRTLGGVSVANTFVSVSASLPFLLYIYVMCWRNVEQVEVKMHYYYYYYNYYHFYF